MKRKSIACAALMMPLALLNQAADASTPPPPPAFVVAIAKQLVSNVSVSNFDAYLANFADDVTVAIDGKVVLRSKPAWAAAERHRLGKVDRFVVGYAAGYDSVLVIDRYDDRSDLPSTPGLLFDPRYKARAVRYSVGDDHLIHAIQIVQTDGVFQTPK